MNKIKIIAAALAATMMLPFAAACSKGDGSSTGITADENAWFDLNEAVIQTDMSLTTFDYVLSKTVGTFDDTIVIRKSGSLKTPTDASINDIDYSDLLVEDLEFFDMNGSLLNSISIGDYLHEHNMAENSYVSRVTKNDDNKIDVTITQFDAESEQDANYRLTIDPSTYELSELVQIEDSEPEQLLEGRNSGYMGSEQLGSYTCEKYWVYSDSQKFSMDIFLIDENNNCTEFDFAEKFPDTEIYDMTAFIDIGNGRYLITAYNYSVKLFYTLDTNTMTLTDVTDTMGWFNHPVECIFQVEGLGSVIMDEIGVYSIDYDNQQINPVFLFENSYVNLSHMSAATPILINDDKAIFVSELAPAIGDSSIERQMLLLTFTKADNNPNEGKTIIRLASTDRLSEPVCDAISEFNQTNSQYFIRVDNSYRISEEYSSATSTDNSGDSGLVRDQASADLGSRLAIDLMSGEGPDIILDGASFPMLNDDVYLLDLSDFTAENFGSDAYFTNIFDAARIDGKLYQIPLSFEAAGILAKDDALAPGQNGFTFEQYQEYVAGPCNGENPIQGGQVDVFITILNCMQDQIIADGHASYNNDAFKTLADYIKEFVTEPLEEGDDFGDVDYQRAALTFVRSSSSYYESTCLGESLVGAPSIDGRGPTIFSSASVGICAASPNADGCKEFIKILMSTPIQERYAAYEGICVNREAFDNSAITFMNSHNSDLEVLARNYSESELMNFGWTSVPMTDADIDEFRSLVEGLTVWYSNDSSINAIIREEMPAYFAGQKTLDQVIPVLEDRAQTVLSERLG